MRTTTLKIIVFLFLCHLCSRSIAQIDSLFEEYLVKREALLQQDSQLYFDQNMILNTAEQKVNQKLAALQKEMLEEYQANHFFPPARNFYPSKKHIESTPLFQLLRQMPKGGILHLHTPAMGDPDWIIDRAIATEEMYVFWEQDTDQFVKGQLYAFPINQVPTGFRQASELDQKEPSFQKELRSLLTFEETMDQDSIDIWKEFEAIFQRINGFVNYDQIFVDYITHGLTILAQDNIQHAELRMSYRNSTYALGKKVDRNDFEKFLHAIQRIDKNIKQVDPHFSFNIIHVNLRFRDKAAIWTDIQQVYQNKLDHPYWLRGYDLVAEEDNGHATLYHAKTFLRLDSLEKVHGVELPLYLHDGESCWASVDNLYDAILLGCKRIGHGFNLFRFPNLMKEVKAKKICIEINPLSNQILGYIRDLRLHPASTYLRQGIQCSISSDDPMIFDYHGLSYDYWSIFLAWELDLAALKQLSKNGILFSAMTDDEKKLALIEWEKRWAEFIDDNTD